MKRFFAIVMLCLSASALAQPAVRDRDNEARADLWQRLTPQQREQLWRSLTPEQKGDVWRRLPSEQRQSIRERLSPEQRDAIRREWQQRQGQSAGPRGEMPHQMMMSPEERQQMREQIREAHQRMQRDRMQRDRTERGRGRGRE